ncbi:MAG: glycosyltransferase [Solirubrobacteraceae bacterium]
MVVHSHYPADVRVRREARAASDAGYLVDVISLRGEGERAYEMIDGIGVRRLPLHHVSGGGARRMLYEYLMFALLAALMLAPSALRRRYAVVQIHNPPDFLLIAGVLPRLFGSTLLLDVHDLSSHMFGARFSGRLSVVISRLLVLLERLAGLMADGVITVHEPYRRELINHGIPAEKISVVMNVPDEGVLEAAEHGKTARNASEFVVAYHGTISGWYGVDLVLDALGALRSEVPTARAMILGDGDARVKLQERALDIGLADHVEFSDGWVAADQALARAASATCGVIPNRPTELNRFALSTKLFEYLALGLPVVVAGLETLTAHFGADEVTFFRPGDAGSLARALIWVAANPQEAAAKTERARERVEREYSWTANRRRYLATLAGGDSTTAQCKV